MEDIRSWWEVPCVSHFCKIFSKPFKLPEYEIEELEDALLLDMNPDPSSLLVQLFVIFLNGIVDRDITEDNWQSFLKLHIRWRCDFLAEKWDPFQARGCDYSGLGAREKVELLHKLCHWRLELDDVGDLVRGYDGPSLRLSPLGRDRDGFLYWFFYGTRLYREAPTKKTVRRKKTEGPAERGRGKNVSSGRKKTGGGRKGPAAPPKARAGGSASRKTPSRARRRRAAAAREDSSDDESQSEGQSSSRGKLQKGRGLFRREAPDDEGYEGSEEEGGSGRRKAKPAKTEQCGGEDETPPVATATPPEEKKESEPKAEPEREGGGDGGTAEEMELTESAATANSNNNSNKRSGAEEGGSAGEGEEGNRRRSLRFRNRKGQKAPEPEKESSPTAVGAEGESSEKAEKEEESEEDDDTNDWQPGSGRGRGRGRAQPGRRRGRNVEGSEGESEVEAEEEEGEPEKAEKEPNEEAKWQIVCNTEEEWEELLASLSAIKNPSVKKLSRALEELLPHVQYLFREREKELKKKMIAELPRRTSDRIALKTQQGEEERLDAELRERQREVLRRDREEEQRRREDEAEERRQKRREEAILRKKAREEEQAKVREEEEKNWQQAMSGELSGPRKAALGAAEGVSEVIKAVEGEGALGDLAMEDEKEEFLYTAFYKVLSGLRRQEDSWVFEEPVTESIAPGYHEQISVPMDYSTVESRLEKKHYSTRLEFETDVKLIFNNCIEYNGDESEYSELANQMLEEFEKLCKVHLDGGGVKSEPELKEKGSRTSRSPSICKTPELTSESSSEEASDGDSDESYSEGGAKAKKKMSGGSKPLLLTPKLSQFPAAGAHLPARPIHPHALYQHQMMMQYRMRFDTPPHMPPTEMMFRPPHYNRLPPPPPYSPHMPRPPPDPHFSPYPPPYPPHYPYHPQLRQGFPPHMGPPAHPPHLSPGSHARPGSVPPGSSSRTPTATPPPAQTEASEPATDVRGEGKEKEIEKGEAVREGEERNSADIKDQKAVQVSEAKKAVEENGASPSKVVHSGTPVPHQISKQQQAVYRYHQQMMMRSMGGRAGHTPPDYYHHYPHGYDPNFPQRHSYPPPQHNPAPPHSQHDGYYQWHRQQAMYGREGRPDVPSEEVRQQQMYWIEMERRRQYYMYQQQRAARERAAHMGRSQMPVAPGNKQGNVEPPRAAEPADKAGKEKSEGEEDRKNEEEKDGEAEGKEKPQESEEAEKKLSVTESEEEGERKMAGEGKSGGEDRVNNESAAESEKEKETAKQLPRDLYRRTHNPPPFPHNGHPGLETDVYSYPPPPPPQPPPPHMYPPHMYGVPPGYGMRPHPSNHLYNEQGPAPHQSSGPEQDVAKSNDKQRILLPQKPQEKGFPHWHPRGGLPPGYGSRPDPEVAIPQNESGFPPGYGPWPRHHGYPPPMDPGMMEQRERWRMEQSSHYRHMHPHQYMHYPYRMATGQRSPHPPANAHPAPQKRPVNHSSPEDTTAPPSKKTKAM